MAETYHCSKCGSKDIYFYPSVNPNDEAFYFYPSVSPNDEAKRTVATSLRLLDEIMASAEMSCNECGSDEGFDRGSESDWGRQAER